MSAFHFEVNWAITGNLITSCKTLFNNQYDVTVGDPVVTDIIQNVVSNFENTTDMCIDQSGDDTTFSFDFPDEIEPNDLKKSIKLINKFISDLETALVKYKI